MKTALIMKESAMRGVFRGIDQRKNGSPSCGKGFL